MAKQTDSFNGKTPRPSVVCHCVDHGCPVHPGLACTRHNEGRIRMRRVYRIDMEDRTGTPMCPECASDALESGVFSSEREN